MKRIAFLSLALAASCGGAQKPQQPAVMDDATGGTGGPAAGVTPADPVSPDGSSDVAREAAKTAMPQELAFAPEEFRKVQPVARDLGAFKAPPVQRFKLSNGIEVFLVESHQLPTVTMTLTFQGGSFYDPEGKTGMAAQCMSLLDDGTKSLEKLAFEAALADLASEVSAGAGDDEHNVSMSSLTRNLGPTLDLWAGIILEPGLRDEDLDRNKKRTIASLKQIKGSAAAISGRVGEAVMYGPEHLLGRVTTEETVQAVTTADCQKFWAETIKPAGARLFVAGDLTRKQVEAEVGGRLGSWKGTPKKAPKIAKAKTMNGKLFFVDVPGAEQSVVSLMHFGPERKANDFVATKVMNTMLGGDFSSRINMNIREKHGYAYGARSGYYYKRQGSVFSASSSVRRDVTIESIREMEKEIVSMRSAPPTDEELDRTMRGEMLSLPSRWATSSDVLQTYASLVYFGLPLTYYDTYVAKVKAVKKKDIEAVSKKHLAPDKLVLVVVGDGKEVLPKLKAYAKEKGWAEGDVVRLDADANVLAPLGG